MKCEGCGYEFDKNKDHCHLTFLEMDDKIGCELWQMLEGYPWWNLVTSGSVPAVRN